MGKNYSKEEKSCYQTWEPQMSDACRNPDAFYSVFTKMQNTLNANDP